MEKIIEVNCETGEIAYRSENTTEQLIRRKVELEEETRANLKSSAVLKLKTLGLTDDEIKALLGQF